MKIPKSLIEKYNAAVPRYTSYPPANYFNETIQQADYVRLLKASNTQKPEQIALYIHIPFCTKICFYCGCNATPMGRSSAVRPYLDALKKEIEIVSKYLDKTRIVSQLHYGGGTPNAIPAEYIAELNHFIFERFNFSPNAEIAIECNPAELDFQYIDALKASGFNRFSLGIQDFDENILKSVNREISKISAAELTDYIRRGSKKMSVNLDFIYGLPGQTPESFADNIRKAIEIRPDRLVTFSYAHVPWLKKHQTVLEKVGLPAAETKTEMFLTARNLLLNAGYVAIGFDHFVLPEDELNIALETNMLHRNFQGYCTRNTTGQVYAFGVSAISQLTSGYIQNTLKISNYIEKLNKGELPVEKGYEISETQNIVKEVITEIMCNMTLNWELLAEKTGIESEKLKQNVRIDNQAITNFVSDGLISFSVQEIKVSKIGSFFIRNIAASLDPAFQAELGKYSKSV